MENAKVPETTDTDEKSRKPQEDRIVMLSDGVFAIAMTLLVLDIKLPEVLPPHTTPGDVLIDLKSKFISYIISFFVIAAYWLTHRRIIGYLKRIDNPFITLNLVFLFFVTALPIPTGFVGQYGNAPEIVIIYTLNLAACGLVLAAMWEYALWNHKLVSSDLEPKEIRRILISVFTGPALFLLSLTLLPFLKDSSSIYYTWLSFPVIAFMLRRFLLGKKPQKAKEQEEHNAQQEDKAAVTPVLDTKN